MFIPVYIILDLVLLYYAFLVGSEAMIILGIVMTVLFLVCFFAGLIGAKKTSVSLSMEEGSLVMSIIKGGILPLTSLRFILQFTYDQSGEGQEVSGRLCFPRGESRAVYPLEIPYAGSARMQARKIRVSDPLGLFRFRIRNSNTAEVRVLPVKEGDFRFVPGDRQVNVYSDYAISMDAVGNDPSETLQVHEYVPGDEINRIHYKLSAKTDKTWVRDFVLESAEYYLFVLDFKERSQAAFHRIITNFYSMAYALVIEESPVLLLWADETGEIYEEPIRSIADLRDTVLYVYETMKTDDYTEDFSLADAAFVLGEFKAMHPNSFFIRQFEITDEPFEKLVRRWQNEL
ncbi:MAG: DUF58 domain-containing protein [Lachnospiraceae bacterium]|nr:DUF58 domain-containing protein [Lachnospiraceae bacterium]